jgi:hypothetical protein
VLFGHHRHIEAKRNAAKRHPRIAPDEVGFLPTPRRSSQRSMSNLGAKRRLVHLLELEAKARRPGRPTLWAP